MEGTVKDMDKKLSERGGVYSIQDYAVSFVYGMGKEQRNRFRQMLQKGYECGESIAKNYGVEYKPFIKEVKRIMEV